jgi:hypothetical protein
VLLAPLALATSLMAMAPQWAIVDLPYPEVTGAETASPPIDARIAEAVTTYARSRGQPLPGKPEMTDLRVEKGTASLRLKMADRTEIVVLLRVNNEWRVLQSLVEGAEY